jgi:hypothetical protein
MACGVTVTDVFGRAVTLAHATWEGHIVRHHPELAPHHDLLPVVLARPHVVVEAKDDGHYHFCRRGFAAIRFRHVWLRVVVAYTGDEGMVLTAWLSRTIGKGVQRWPRRKR